MYIRDSLSRKERPDMTTLPECLICELHLDMKKYLFLVMYKSPNQDQEEFECFMDNLERMISKMYAKEPYAVITTKDIKCRSLQRRRDDNENDEWRQLEQFCQTLDYIS